MNKRLWQSVMLRAVLDLVGSDEVLRKEVVEWIETDPDFDLVCELSGEVPTTIQALCSVVKEKLDV